jgi:hypothetical protein
MDTDTGIYSYVGNASNWGRDMGTDRDMRVRWQERGLWSADPKLGLAAVVGMSRMRP